jgi:hypothetical protein
MASTSLRRALAVLAATEAAAKGSFLHALHERDLFDTAAFRALDAAMTVIAAAPPGARGRGTRRRAARVHRAVLMHIVHHLNPHDGACIRRFPGRTLQAFLDRLEWTFAPVIEGQRGYGRAGTRSGRKPG